MSLARWLFATIALIGSSFRLGGQISGSLGAVVSVVEDHVAGKRDYISRFKYFPLEGGRLHLSFDLLGEEEPILAYRIKHYSADWSPSALMPVEFIGGFDSYELDAPQLSRNTLQRYVHYKLTIPNAQTELKVSGNYQIEIFSTDNPDIVLLSYPFAVYESLVSVDATLTSRTWLESDGRYQQVNLSVDTNGVSSLNTIRDFRPVVLQNGRWDNAKVLSLPSSSHRGVLSYEAANGAVFEAGNEYHKLEHLRNRGGGLGVQSIEQGQDLYVLQLYPQHCREIDSYVYDEDKNGLEIVRTVEGGDDDIDADYHLVRFTYISPWLSDGDIVIDGMCVQHQPLSNRTLKYDSRENSYVLTLPLKMGYQEYQYLYKPKNKVEMIVGKTEGSHYQTTNDYTILVYQRLPTDRADRLVGVAQLR